MLIKFCFSHKDPTGDNNSNFTENVSGMSVSSLLYASVVKFFFFFFENKYNYQCH